MTLKTSQVVRAEFDRTGDSISEWAVAHGYSPSLVYRVLRSTDLPKRGKSHDIVVKLVMKRGEVSAIRAGRQMRPSVSASKGGGADHADIKKAQTSRA